MPHHENVTISGEVADVFAHRFTVQTAEGRVLADLTPHGVDKITLKTGDKVTLVGEMKPSELKVMTYTSEGGETITIEHKKPHEDDADPEAALKTARAQGYTVLGKPRRKPKHFEILGRDKSGAVHELHVELDGKLRKSKPVDADEPKWAHELAS